MKTVQRATEDVFTAIAHPLRRELLNLLAGGEHTAGQLAAPFAVTRPAVSQHLRVLLDAGLVRERRDGRERRYRLDPDRLTVVRDWLASHERLWRLRLHALGDYLDGQEQP
ncbi:MAG TPA: metalloregulator ArsR/SmtB family transcription factor [Actinomycetota bacterium]|nr:metalloregulator ArsR/SmtB family transcription factor [Actinomycetota bacterium]